MSQSNRPSPENVDNHPIFSAFTPAQRERVLSRAETVHVDRGETLFHEGDPARRIFLCESGQLKLYRLAPSGNEKIIALIQPGSTFAEATMFMEERNYPVNCEALKASRLIAFDADDCVAMLREDVDSCFSLMAMFSRRLRQRLTDIEALSLQNATLRVANYILQLQQAQGESDTLDLPTSKKHIAGLLALQPETLSRVFAQLQDTGALRVEARRITILDPERFHNIAYGLENA
ncbi:Crp/Fnr family transcriptional regulator [Natronospira bacteriovora]|uniref:Crp/Fnr family transcriptional regulator n=1 Tax=Natronospira bacteriovora TaxID=3069753 RepID=A0ABU0W3T0_9GAMM|nr:Crp/Fnr family transcriptional regulator [Natronospira sp. AB-CW4]MDQ2068679.1 Crp/Fnr family transcriptional regulator [Natronospira sp. AB-CW4]